MKDVNGAILKAFYDAIVGVVDPSVKVFEGMAPPTNTSNSYVIINYPISIDASTKSTSDLKCTIQIDVNTSSDTVVNSTAINTIFNNILEAVISEPDGNLNLGSGFQMSNIIVFNDRTEAPSELANRMFLTRKVIFQFNVFIK